MAGAGERWFHLFLREEEVHREDGSAGTRVQYYVFSTTIHSLRPLPVVLLQGCLSVCGGGSSFHHRDRKEGKEGGWKEGRKES